VFENLLNEIENLKSVSVPIECDGKGYIDKQCPSEECEFLFKVNEDDWANIFVDESVWCPLCRHEATSDKWFTLEQIEYAESEALSVVEGTIHNAMSSDAKKFNSKQSKNNFISISMEVKGGTRRTYAIPAKATEIMQLEINCEECNSRFAVIGSAFFCPSCGNNSVTRTYFDSLRKIKAKRDNVEVVRKALIEVSGEDEAELTCRSLRETCITDGVAAFQKYCEGLYKTYDNPPFNAFQRLNQGSELWEKQINKGYDTWLSDNDLKNLNILYQKRHLLSHNEGIVDKRYIEKSRDTFYKEGQRIVVSDKDIDKILVYLEKLGVGLRDECNKQQTILNKKED
jgi:rRNA maturation endonuclease Nob1